jgi:hypothetical protein
VPSTSQMCWQPIVASSLRNQEDSILGDIPARYVLVDIFITCPDI